MNKSLLKEIGIYVAIAALFAVLAYGFMPELLSGKQVNQSDISGWKGMAQETIKWNKEHPGDKTWWSDSMFGGMPMVTSIDDFDGDWTKPLYKLMLWGKRPAAYLFIALLGAFLMMLSMGINRFIAVAGAIAVAFCAYNFQIIQVGHNTKMQAIAFAPWAIAAFIFTYRQALKDRTEEGLQALKRSLPVVVLGSVLFGLALSFQIKANHVQITYYLAIILLIYAIATLIWVLKKENRGKFTRFAAASALLLLTTVVGIGTNANKLIPIANYAPYTMRGGSELTAADANQKGLSLDYATAWSYGIEETPNLLIPNFNGGSSSGALGPKSATYQLFKKAGANPKQVCRSLPLYWGPQPFTAGPMYIGAISIFLFILGLFLLDGREKWWLLLASILAILLSWGNHFMWFTELWFKYAPMYNKFRTVSMALVTLQFCVPLLGFYTLDLIVKEAIPHRQVVKGLWWSFGIVGGFCLISAMIPSIAGSFSAPSDSGMQDVLVDALRQDRRHLLSADAWTSFMLVTIAAGVMMWSYLKPDPFAAAGRVRIAAAVIGVLTLVNMWAVGKRYLSADDFVKPREMDAQFALREADKYILEDNSPSYRVLDLSESTFNSSVTSYRHKSIGGYSPTKMQRYQDLIEHYLSKEISAFYKAAGNAGTLGAMQDAMPYMPVTSMLNGRYFIIGADYPPLVNENAFGPAWFADNVVTAPTADREIALLGEVDLRHTAVVREPFDFQPAGNPGGQAYGEAFITLESYAPNELHYRYSCTEPSLAVFSEIYHPSWKAELNGQPLDLFAADWVLRGAVLPAGDGEVVMRFECDDIVRGERLSRASSIMLILMLVGSVAGAIVGRKKENLFQL